MESNGRIIRVVMIFHMSLAPPLVPADHGPRGWSK